MKILVLNGSPSGKNSITLYTVLYLEKLFPECSFEILHVGQQIKRMEMNFSDCAEKLQDADLILFCYPVYTFLAPAQLHRFVELIKEQRVDLRGKYATQITTSKHFYDVTAHQFVQDNCDDLGLHYVRGLSADMEDLLSKRGRREAEDFFRFVLWSMEHAVYEPVLERHDTEMQDRLIASNVVAAEKTKPGKIVVVTDLPPQNNGNLFSMLRRFSRVSTRQVTVYNLREFPFKGGCLGCFHCASDGKCIYKDGFDTFLREHVQTADAIVYAYTIRDHSMGYRFKLFDDRQFCNGHRTVTMGKPVGYLVDGALDMEPNLRMLMEARAQVGGNYLAGIATNQHDPDREIDQLALTLNHVLDEPYQPPQNFYGVGGMKIFRDLIYQMQGLMREDHKFYKAHGFYDFPQKQKGKTAAMYLVGAMMNNKALSKKLGGKMTEGMIMPYQKVLENVEGGIRR